MPCPVSRLQGQAGIVIFFSFMFTGMVCYISYGDITNGSMTAELAQRSSNPVIGFLNLMIALAVGLTYPMQVRGTLARSSQHAAPRRGASAHPCPHRAPLPLKRGRVWFLSNVR